MSGAFAIVRTQTWGKSGRYQKHMFGEWQQLENFGKLFAST